MILVQLEMDAWTGLEMPFLHVNTSWYGNYTNGSMNNTASSNISDHPYPYYQHSIPVAASLILVYLFIFLLCMVGNGLVCLIVLKNRRMRTVTNLFILNLAVSDLLVGIFCIPTTLVDNLITGSYAVLQSFIRIAFVQIELSEKTLTEGEGQITQMLQEKRLTYKICFM